MITIDGSFGEGGGQILRSSLALSAITKTPVSIAQIRKNRSKPGLRAQHRCCARAAARVCNGLLHGDEIGSTALQFEPQDIVGGVYEFEIETAGSCSLVLQTVLPMFLHARSTAEMHVYGGTHNSWAPSLDFLDQSFFQVLRRLGVQISVEVIKAGFYPRGGGHVLCQLDASNFKGSLEIIERGRLQEARSIISTAGLKEHVAEREETQLRKDLGLKKKQQHCIDYVDTPSVGNYVSVVDAYEHITCCFGEPGKQGVAAERIASKVAKQCRAFRQQDAAVDEYLADQLMLPLLLADGGIYSVSNLSLHSKTNAAVIEQFCGSKVSFVEREELHCVQVEPINTG